MASASVLRSMFISANEAYRLQALNKKQRDFNLNNLEQIFGKSTFAVKLSVNSQTLEVARKSNMNIVKLHKHLCLSFEEFNQEIVRELADII